MPVGSPRYLCTGSALTARGATDLRDSSFGHIDGLSAPTPLMLLFAQTPYLKHHRIPGVRTSVRRDVWVL